MEETQAPDPTGERAMVEMWRLLNPTARTRLFAMAAVEAAKEVGREAPADESQSSVQRWALDSVMALR